MPICAGCGGSYDDSFKFCPNCGRFKEEATFQTKTVEIHEKQRPYDCPICENSQSVRKVSAIVSDKTVISKAKTTISGASQIYSNHTGEVIGNGYSVGTASNYQKNQSLLAEKLTLPREPFEPHMLAYEVNFEFWGVIIFFILYILGCVMFTLNDLVRVIFCYSPIFAAIGTWLIWILVNKINNSKGKYQNACEEYEKYLNIFHLVKIEWDELYYCFKHDITFSLSKNN